MKVQLEKILCPIDFSATAGHAAQYAVSLSESYRASLILLHVLQPPVTPLPDHYQSIGGKVELGGIVFDASITRHPHNAPRNGEAQDTRLETLVTELKKKHRCRITALRRTGKAFLEIIAVANQENVDLIVMGTHGRTGLHHMLIGSTAEKVIRMATCSVLAVRHPEHTFGLPLDGYPRRDVARKRLAGARTV